MLTIFTKPNIRLILAVIVVMVLAYILIKYRATKNPIDNSLDILKKRLGKGEISQEDYEEAKRRQDK